MKGAQSTGSARDVEPGGHAGDDPASRLARVRDVVLPALGRVVACVSGGRDSMALLGAVAAALPGRADVAWVDHGWRARTPDRGLVERACARLGLPFAALRVDPGPRTETAARRARHAVLAAHARERDAATLLLAHHAHDDDETMLLHLRRGHLEDRALAGMPHLRRLGAGGPWLARPFLMGAPLSPDALDAWRRARDLVAYEDPTNADLSIPRNAVRARLRSGAFDRDELRALRRAARGRLRRRVGAVARLLGRAERVDQGIGFDRAVLRVWLERHGTAGLAELLRLLGPALGPARRLDPRAAVVARLAERIRSGRGRLWLPGRPLGAWCVATRGAVMLPDAWLGQRAPAVDPFAALLASPLYVDA